MLGGVFDPALRVRAVEEVVTALKRALNGEFVGAILKGSALKGDFFPHWSDLDVHAFAAAPAMQGPRRPRPDVAFALQRELGAFDAASFGLGSLQVYCLSATQYPAEWVKPIPGTYELVAGRLPDAFLDVDVAAYRAKAAQDVDQCLAFISSRLESMIDKPHRELAGVVRRVGIDMKVLAYAIPIVVGEDPVRAWRWPLATALDTAEALALPGRPLSGFFALVDPWPADAARARHMLELALNTAEQTARWRTRL